MITDTPARIGQFAVMRHRQGMKNANFCALHDSHDSAMNEAKRLTADTIARTVGEITPFRFYVVEIVGHVGIINGALQASS
jgi:formylmethanofuran:tetrahydromethanopterin formyltransferase